MLCHVRGASDNVQQTTCNNFFISSPRLFHFSFLYVICGTWELYLYNFPWFDTTKLCSCASQLDFSPLFRSSGELLMTHLLLGVRGDHLVISPHQSGKVTRIKKKWTNYVIFHCRFMSLTSMQADSFTANLSWNFKLQLVFLNRLHAFSTWHLRFNPVFSFQMWHSNIMFILQLSEWDEENVILTGSIDGVVRVSIILVFLLFMFFINFLLNFFFQWQIFFGSNIY